MRTLAPWLAVLATLPACSAGPNADGDSDVPDGLGLPDVVAEVEALDSAPLSPIRAGIAISAPMTKNTAAMTTRGNCIAVLLGPRQAGGR